MPEKKNPLAHEFLKYLREIISLADSCLDEVGYSHRHHVRLKFRDAIQKINDLLLSKEEK